MTRIHLIGSSDDFGSAVATALDGADYDVEHCAATGFDPEVVSQITNDPGDLVTVGPALDEADALKFLAELAETAPHLPGVLIADPTAELWPQAVRAGARDIIPELSSAASLREALERSLETGRKLREAAPASEPTGVAAARGRVIAVVSPKGGSGKTTVAANLAATIARSRPGEVVVADLDVQFGDIAYAYRIDPDYSLLNAVSPGTNPTVLKGFLTPHESKVLALAAPERPEDADDIDPQAAADVVRTLSELFPVTVVDTGAGLDDHTLAVLEVATDVVLVSATDVPSVRAVVKELDILDRLGLLADRSNHLVLNRADARVGLSATDIEKTIGFAASLSIPSTRAIPSALNHGEPLVLQDPRGAVARGFTEFATDLGVISPSSPAASRPWRKK